MGHCDDPQNVIFWTIFNAFTFWTLGAYSNDPHYVLFSKIILESLSQENSELTTPPLILRNNLIYRKIIVMHLQA